MATVTLSQSFNFLSSQDWDWVVTSASASNITITNGVYTQTFSGSFSYDINENVFGSAYATNFYINGSLVYSVTGMSANASQLQTHAETYGDTQQTYAYVLRSNDTFNGSSGNDTIIGYDGNDLLKGNGGNDYLAGRSGSDTMLGGSDNDTYIVDSALDKVYETTTAFTTTDAGGTADRVLSSVTHTLGSYVENLTLSGTSAINGTGNVINNILTGNAAANTLNGSSGYDTLLGGNGNDYLLGGAGTDRLLGEGNNDTLSGGVGNDTLIGGWGNDTFRFDSTLNATTNVDRISDFVGIYDTIQLENAIFTKLVTTGALSAANYSENTAGVAMDSNDYIIYETDTGNLYYDWNGNGAWGQVKIATLWDSATTHPAASEISYSDFLIT